MAGKTPPKSVAAFVEPIKDALGCFAKCKVLADVHDPGKRGVLTVDGLEPVDLNGNAAVAIQISLRYEIVEHPERGPWKVKTLGYSHRVLLDGGRSATTTGTRSRTPTRSCRTRT